MSKFEEGRKEGKTGEEEGVGTKRSTFHVPGRLIKFQKLKHHLLRVFSRLVVGPEKSAERVATPFQRIKHIFHQTRLARLPAQSFARLDGGQPLGEARKIYICISLFFSTFLPPSLFSPISLWLYGLVWLTIAVSILVPIHRIVKQCPADYSI